MVISVHGRAHRTGVMEDISSFGGYDSKYRESGAPFISSPMYPNSSRRAEFMHDGKKKLVHVGSRVSLSKALAEIIHGAIQIVEPLLSPEPPSRRLGKDVCQCLPEPEFGGCENEGMSKHIVSVCIDLVL